MSFLVLLVPIFSNSHFSPFQAIECVKSQCSHYTMSTILVPISVAEGLLLVPFSLKIWSPFGPPFEKFRFPFHVGAVPPPPNILHTAYFSDWGQIYRLSFSYGILPFPINPSLAYKSVYKLIYCLYNVHKSVSQVLVTSMLQKFSIYRVYCSLKIVDISVPQTNILPIYRLNIISDTLVPRAFRKYSTCL